MSRIYSIATVSLAFSVSACAFSVDCRPRSTSTTLRMASDWKDGELDSNQWASSNEEPEGDWQETLQSKQDGSFWSDFAPSEEDLGDKGGGTKASVDMIDDEDEADAFLDQLSALAAEELQFNQKEGERADTAFRMAEYGFDAETISSALNVTTDLSQESEDEVKGMEEYRLEAYEEEIDLETVESHTQVEIDPETDEPVRAQMVYVDEHECIGCTNCAMVAQSTFFMHSEHGRARVFQQWGDDDETIQIAIETCPVDCIHYVPYDELVRLEKERRDQNINFKARLVSQGEYGNSLSHRVGGNTYTAPQKISGNMKPRCNNCPSRGCYDCPMFGVGKNPEFEKKEKARKARMAKRKLQEERERDRKSLEL